MPIIFQTGPPDTVFVAVPREYASWVGPVLQTALGASAAILGGIWAQNHRARLEVDRTRAQLVRRVRGTLETYALSARSLSKRDENHVINAELLNGIVTEWSRYDRMSDDLDLIGNPDLEERIETILMYGRMIAEKALLGERHYIETGKTESAREHPERALRAIAEHRKAHLKFIKALALSAEQVLDQFNLQWKPGPRHQPRIAPESGEEVEGKPGK